MTAELIAALEKKVERLTKLVAGQQVQLEEQATDSEKSWALLDRVVKRTDKLKLAVPHVQFQDW